MAKTNNSRPEVIAHYLSLLQEGQSTKDAKFNTATLFQLEHETLGRYIRDYRARQAEFGEMQNILSQKRGIGNGAVEITTARKYTKRSASDVWNRQMGQNELRIVDEEGARHIKLEFKENLPIGLAWISDHHLDDPRCDLQQAELDALTIKDTDGLYLGSGGDELNWYIKQIAKFPKFDDHELPVRERIMLFEHWVSIVGEKMLFALAGNHNFYAYSANGIMYERGVFEGLDIHYSKDSISADIRVGDQSYLGYFSHTYWGKSRINPVHELIRMARHAIGSRRPDIVGCGHRHDPVTGKLWLDGSPIYVMKSGSYKLRAADFEGQGSISESGQLMPMMVLLPDKKRVYVFDDLLLGADFLTYLRTKYRKQK